MLKSVENRAIMRNNNQNLDVPFTKAESETEEATMAYSYNRLWKPMIDKKINKTTLRREAGITSNTMAKWVRMNLLQKIRTSSMILSAYAQKLFSGVKNVQCQQHGTVKEYADSKNKLKVTPF